jgi:hypothetical protein
MSIQFHDAGWKYLTYVIPASLGQGVVYPGILFTFLAAFDHTGKLGALPHRKFRAHTFD